MKDTPTTWSAFLEHVVFCNCRHEIDTRGIAYLVETIHAWKFPSRAAAQSAANKFEELTIRYNLETKPGVGFLYSCEVVRSSLCRPMNRRWSFLSKDGKSTWNNSQMETGSPYTLSDLKVANASAPFVLCPGRNSVNILLL